MSCKKIIAKLQSLYQYIMNLARRKRVNSLKLYKFRSLQNFEYTADIILKNRLYAADFETMNDIMEGIFYHEGIVEDILERIKDAKSKLKICSMSGEVAFSSPLMWAHYADSFKGVCLEFEIDESEVEVKEIIYEGDSVLTLREDVTSITEEEAKILLCKKYPDWKYEEEYRIFSRDEHVEDGVELKKIYLGERISETNKELIKKIVPEGVEVIDTDFDKRGRIIIKE